MVRGRTGTLGGEKWGAGVYGGRLRARKFVKRIRLSLGVSGKGDCMWREQVGVTAGN